MYIYERVSGITISRKNVYCSTIFRLLDRYFWKLSRGVQDVDYDIKIITIIEDLIKELELIELREKEGAEIE